MNYRIIERAGETGANELDNFIIESRGYDSVIRRMKSWVCLLYNLYNTHDFILHMTSGHTKNELMGVV